MVSKKGIASIITIVILIILSAGVGFGAYFISQKIKLGLKEDLSTGQIEEFTDPEALAPSAEPVLILPSPSLAASAIPTPQSLSVNFTQSGNILDWDVATESHTGNWQLLYEKSGNPALSVNLVFDQSSQCDLAWGYQVCQPSNLINGEMAKVEGNRVGDKVTVIRLKKI